MSPGCLRRVCLLAVLLAANIVPTGNAQTAPAMQAPQPVVPLCAPDAIDGIFTFANQPAGEQTVSLHFQNKGSAACRLQGQAGPSFAVDGHSMHVASCWLCDQNNTPSPAPQRESGNQILLAPGERARLDLHWATAGERCQWADWVSFFVDWAKQTSYLFVPSEWPMHICSAVKSSGYTPESNRELREEALRVSMVQPVIYSDERATLHIEVAGQTASASDPNGCASLYTVQQGASIGTRFDPLPTVGSSSRPSYTPEQMTEDKDRPWPSWKRDHLRRCWIPGGRLTADANISAAVLANVTHIEWRTVPAPGHDPVFLTATTHFTVLDVATLPPNWGEPVKGIRTGLSVDRPTFTVGERVPLHLLWENVNAATPLGQGECQAPEPALELQDAQHKVVRTIPMERMCMGHGWGPFEIQKGKRQRSFVEFATGPSTTSYSGVLVTPELPGPGVYYVVSVWSPHVLVPPASDTDKTGRIGSPGEIGGVYATARSQPVRIEVVAHNSR